MEKVREQTYRTGLLEDFCFVAEFVDYPVHHILRDISAFDTKSLCFTLLHNLVVEDLHKYILLVV
jgi:hypothetical protein